MPARIAYIMSRFPKLSETFILREMIALQDADWDVSVYPLILERTSVVHDEAKPWLDKLNYFPWLSGKIIISNLREFFGNPFRYISLWLMVLWGNIFSPKFLVRALMLFPKTVHIAAHMKQRGIAHIHAHYATHPALMAWIIHKLIGISYSVTVHAHDIYVDRSMLATKLKDASFIVAISEFNRQFLIRHLGEWVAEKVHVVHCGIDPQKYSAGISRTIEGRFNIVSIGSLQPYKGMKYLIEACALLKARALPVSCKIIGAGEEHPALDALISQSGLHDCVELVGPKTQSEVAQLLREANCYAQPSVITPSGKMEGIPVALMEALSCSLPVIASDLSGIPELVRHNETGYLVPPADAKALANALEYVYNHSEEAGKLASAGCGLVRMEFEIQKNVAQLAELFSEKLSCAGHEG